MTGKSEVHIKVYGRVQGVFFRATAKEAAKGLGLVGHVTNAPDGSVEMAIEGDFEKADQVLEAIVALNPRIVIDRVEKTLHPLSTSRTSFEVIRIKNKERLSE